jgi:hypothetical protein
VSTHGAVRELRYGQEMAASLAAADPGYAAIAAEMLTEPAGWPGPDVWVSLSTWITVSYSPDAMFVDCRSGDLHGCVMTQFQTGGQLGPRWPSVAAMWAEAADILESIDPTAPPEQVETSVGAWAFPPEWWMPLT